LQKGEKEVKTRFENWRSSVDRKQEASRVMTLQEMETECRPKKEPRFQSTSGLFKELVV
jgi:hypothetical protein